MANVRGIGSAIHQKGDATQPGTAVLVGGSSTTVASANSGRAEITLTNDHATQVVCLRLDDSPAVLNQGIRLNAAGGQWKSAAYLGEIRAIATGADTPVLVAEV